MFVMRVVPLPRGRLPIDDEEMDAGENPSAQVEG
jgi:hypothetical protein